MNHVAKSSLIVAFFFGVDKVLGFGRQLLVARQFSLSYELDVFNAANNIPDLLSALISGGALGIALIPVLSEYLEKSGKKAAWELFSRILNLAFVVTALFAVIIAVIAPVLVDKVIAPGFPAEQKELTVSLLRLDLIAILIFSISGLIMAGLQANQHFILPALAPGLYNLGQIFGVAILAPETGISIAGFTLPAFGLGIYGLVYGVIFGAILHLLIQVPGLIRYKFTWKAGFDLKSPGVKQVLVLLGPRILTMFFIQLFFIVRDNLASGMGEGSVTALNLGWFIMQVPETLLGTAFAIALLPTISEQFAAGDLDSFRKSVNTAVRTMLALTIPVAALMAVGIEPIVQTAFDFNAAETGMVVSATRIYLLGLASHTLLEIGSRSFYAQKNAKTPLLAAAINAFMYLFVAILLSKRFGFTGIAFANTIAFTFEAVLLLILLNRKHPEILKVRNTLARVLIPTILISATFFLALNKLNFSPLILSVAGMVLGFIPILFFILPEIRLVLKLGKQKY